MSIKIKSSREKKVADSDDDDLVADGTPTMTVEDASAFDCGVCYLPFKPPIFQCIEGHAVCSTCRQKLMATTGGNTIRCYVCRVDLGKRGHMRSYAMERMVESVRVPCPNAVHGCAARPTYYDRSSHRKACPHARYSCSGHGCGGFVGSAGALLDHVASVHTNNSESMQQFWAEELGSLMNRLKLSMAPADIGMGVDPRDVELVMSQAGVSMDKAAKALKEAGGDIVTAIMDLTN